MNQHLLLGLSLALLVLGCSTSVYRPAQTGSFSLDDPREIDDDDIAKAFLAAPQMPEAPEVAYYVFDEAHAPQVEAMLRETRGISSTYRIPSLLARGERRFDRWPPPTPQPLSLKQLRLLAARAHSDLLVVVDYGHEVREIPNGWVATSVMLVPLLFTPWIDVQVESYVDTYVVDVRNGYLYGQISSRKEAREELHTIYNDAGKRLIGEQLGALLGDTSTLLAKLLSEESKLKQPKSAIP